MEGNKRGKEERWREMEKWRPLLDIFCNSPTPEADAALWLHQQQSHGPIPRLAHSAFLSFLLNPSSHHHHSTGCMSIQTLPNAVQSRILSFLAVESRRFPSHYLRSLAHNILNTLPPQKLDIWVRKAALNLLNHVSPGAGVCRPSGEEEFESLPLWLRDLSSTGDSLLSWLPLSPERLYPSTRRMETGSAFEIEGAQFGKEGGDAWDQPLGSATVISEQDSAMDPESEAKATALKGQFSSCDSATSAISLAGEIRQLCLSSQSNCFDILELIEPWQASDEIIAVFLPKLLVGVAKSPLPGQILSAVLLPKFLTLQNPPSRLLMSATIDYCKNHQIAAAEGLLFPLILRKEGLNTPLCDVLTKIIRECLHPAHISAFFQRLLCSKKEERRLFCLPCHRSLLSEKLVWTEALFALFQNLLNLNVYLTPDSVDEIVAAVDEMAGNFSKSLKFGNFLLCLVGKCGPSLKLKKDLLIFVAERTETFITKSILSKLDAL